MSSAEHGKSAAVRARRAALGALALALAGVSACTVQPLYANRGATGSLAPGAVSLSSVAVEPVTTRPAQLVRNHLVFLLNGGAAQPAAPQYKLTLNVGAGVSASATVQRVTLEEPTAQTVTMSSSYVLTDATTGRPVASGRRVFSSSFDYPRQPFAAARAQDDATARAARELAELMRLAIAQDLARLARK